MSEEEDITPEDLDEDFLLVFINDGVSFIGSIEVWYQPSTNSRTVRTDHKLHLYFQITEGLTD